MMDGIGGMLALGFDGLVLCVGLGVLTPRRWGAPLALAFGLCDAAATACGALWGGLVPRAFEAEGPRLLALGLVVGAAALALFASRPPESKRGARAAFLLPLLASVDNLVTGAHSSGSELLAASLATALLSAALAYGGLRAGAFLKNERFGLRAAGSAS
jgi:hypothetical protein